MALVGNMISDAFHGSSSTVNYILFVSAFSMLTLIYLFAAGISESFIVHPVLLFLVDLLNTIFIFCGAIALPSKLRVHDCSNRAYTSQNSITRGAPNQEQRCREAQATTAFLWFLWATFVASTVISGLGIRGSMVDLRGPRPGRRSRPSMSQV
ncbi:hypothetical protein AJ78_08172 [Emergomyces pasteurianus Ep9510]|uniref:MARVEL domain-containing protein n=1 Tax=Emergomyces pasteurianus Ep9510 TaxID=1447872 RepID=A0A1J9P493_9EURO|nr:hypothetical protein AJ78_08172 [Emergomyces pasteurianus Ep9510]